MPCLVDACLVKLIDDLGLDQPHRPQLKRYQRPPSRQELNPR